jgi:hypothetical protein
VEQDYAEMTGTRNQDERDLQLKKRRGSKIRERRIKRDVGGDGVDERAGGVIIAPAAGGVVFGCRDSTQIRKPFMASD